MNNNTQPSMFCKRLLPSLVVLLLFAISCNTNKPRITKSGLHTADFDTLVNDKYVGLYTLTNRSGMEVCVTNYGARVVSIMVPDRDGEMRDVVLGFDNIGDYMENQIPFGATIGRNANRIRGGLLPIDGKGYELQTNDNGHSTHGGPDGWAGQIFTVHRVKRDSIILGYFSTDKESGFPGDVYALIVYSLSDDNTLNIDYRAHCNAPTVVNLTNHSYFSLTGDPSKSVMSSSIMIKSDTYAPKADDNVPRGDLKSVDGTPLDFRTPVRLDKCLEENSDFVEIKQSNGFGVTMTLRNEEGDDEADIILSNPESGIIMEVFTSQPSVQFFSCNAYDKEYVGKKGITYNPRNAICLETQHHPNAVNVPSWPSPILRPDEFYNHYCRYRFSVDK